MREGQELSVCGEPLDEPKEQIELHRQHTLDLRGEKLNEFYGLVEEEPLDLDPEDLW